MLAYNSQKRLSSRTRLLIGGAVGLSIGLLALFLFSLPNWGGFAQLSQLSLLQRVSLLIKVFSPIVLFLISWGWSWVLLWKWEDRIVTRFLKNSKPSQLSPSQRTRNDATASLTFPRQLIKAVPLAVPPLFQLEDPTQASLFTPHLLPVTPLPAVSPSWKPASPEQEVQDDGEDVSDDSLPTDQQKSPGSDLREEEGNARSIFPAQEHFNFSATPALLETQNPAPIHLTFLKRVKIELHAEGFTKEVKIRLGEKGIRLITLAYIAWHKGEPVDRDKLLTYVLNRGRRRDMNTEQLTMVFESIKRFLREDLREAVLQLNQEADREVIDPNSVDFFSNEPGAYWLHSSCQVVDLEIVEQYHRSIQQARKDGLIDEKLNGSPPDWVIADCQSLIKAYTGDFLQELRGRHPDEFGAWVREPVTLYRDYYLDALWLLALAESSLGKNFTDENLIEEKMLETRRYHMGRAAQLFFDYAMYAINSKSDSKLKFAYRAGTNGARINAAERAIRRCFVELGKLGKTETIDQVFDSFRERMLVLSENNWKPEPKTVSDFDAAKQQTSAYRFSMQQDQKFA